MSTSLSDFVGQYPVRSFKRNEILLLQDDQPTTMYCIKSGFVKGYDIDSQGTEQVLWLGSEGDFFPITWVFDVVQTAPYFFGAMGNVEAYAVPSRDFRKFIDTNHDALLEITNKLAVRLMDTYRHLNAVEKAKAEEKLVYSLYFLSIRFIGMKDKALNRIALPITQQDIASLVGISRETASVELKKLKDRGLVHYDKYDFVIYPDRLQAEI